MDMDKAGRRILWGSYLFHFWISENSEHRLGHQRSLLSSPLPHLRVVVVEALHRRLAARRHAPCRCPTYAALLRARPLRPAGISATASSVDTVHGPYGTAAGDVLHRQPLAAPGSAP